MAKTESSDRNLRQFSIEISWGINILDVRFYPEKNRKALSSFEQGIISHLYQGLQIQMPT